jgi:hypothetical protein
LTAEPSYAGKRLVGWGLDGEFATAQLSAGGGFGSDGDIDLGDFAVLADNYGSQNAGRSRQHRGRSCAGAAHCC